MHSVLERCYFVVVLASMLSSCSASVRSLQPEEIAGSKADELLFFITDQRIIKSHPDSCSLTRTDSQRVLHIQGIEQIGVNQKESKPFKGDLATSAIDSIQARYRPSIYHAGPLFLVLSAAFIGLVLISWRIIVYH